MKFSISFFQRKSFISLCFLHLFYFSLFFFNISSKKKIHQMIISLLLQIKKYSPKIIWKTLFLIQKAFFQLFLHIQPVFQALFIHIQLKILLIGIKGAFFQRFRPFC
ncbi:hypothetical protein IMG5_176440 [Ichthyophthirius multifiliis]|uniref:Transmembrane protein n=1 Tax=Ichthyophthirius multifiliis TaxID=5932 RepID=G0R2B2_ICHMU|nr:hypothetical protein IMG5_176440 [Ichthyophthirius multifiliis]EGR28388.1 hypothetical protein IMG5_176440 [Ichthyophthirius multifiliis]|eukprot:XP_004027733.1 hypothetical protein IMG5_176440 [Ichthyophthirius multifiliis]